MYMRAELDTPVEDHDADLTNFWDMLNEHDLVYKIEIDDDARTMVMYGGVDPNDESKVTRMEANLDQVYMQFVYAHALEDPDPDAPLSDSEDETLKFGPPRFGMCEATSDEALSLFDTRGAVCVGRAWKNPAAESVGGEAPTCGTSEAADAEDGAIVAPTGSGGADPNLNSTIGGAFSSTFDAPASSGGADPIFSSNTTPQPPPPPTTPPPPYRVPPPPPPPPPSQPLLSSPQQGPLPGRRSNPNRSS